MALNKNTLGAAIHNVRQSFNDKTIADLDQLYGSLDNARLAMANAEAEVIINHFKDNAEGRYQNGTLIAGTNAVTPVSGQTIAVKIF